MSEEDHHSPSNFVSLSLQVHRGCYSNRAAANSQEGVQRIWVRSEKVKRFWVDDCGKCLEF